MSPHSEPGKATLVAILQAVNGVRKDLAEGMKDHEARIRVLERKRTMVSALSGAVASVIVALIAALAGCAAPKVDPAALSREATAQVHGYAVWSEGMGTWTGTAWAIASDGKATVLATAGHVCASDAALDGYFLSDGRAAYVIYDRDNAPFDDVCLLAVEGGSEDLDVGRAAQVGDRVVYTGYPNGTVGTYGGLVSEVDETGVLTVSVPTYFGSSGSALLDKDGRVVGLCSMADMRFPHHSWWSGTAALVRAEDYAEAYLVKLRADPFGTVAATYLGTLEEDNP